MIPTESWRWPTREALGELPQPQNHSSNPAELREPRPTGRAHWSSCKLTSIFKAHYWHLSTQPNPTQHLEAAETRSKVYRISVVTKRCQNVKYYSGQSVACSCGWLGSSGSGLDFLDKVGWAPRAFHCVWDNCPSGLFNRWMRAGSIQKENDWTQ